MSTTTTPGPVTRHHGRCIPVYSVYVVGIVLLLVIVGLSVGLGVTRHHLIRHRAQHSQDEEREAAAGDALQGVLNDVLADEPADEPADEIRKADTIPVANRTCPDCLSAYTHLASHGFKMVDNPKPVPYYTIHI